MAGFGEAPPISACSAAGAAYDGMRRSPKLGLCSALAHNGLPPRSSKLHAGPMKEPALSAALALCAFVVACGEGQPSSAEREQFRASASRVEAEGVSLVIEPCGVPQQCDFLFGITNGSDHCVAFSEMELPSRTSLWLDTTLNVPRRIEGVPTTRARQTFVILPPGSGFRQGVDVQAISGMHDLGYSTLRLTTHFIRCTGFDTPTDAVQLQSGAITFERTP